MKFSSTFLALAIGVSNTLAAPSVQPRADSDANNGPVASCKDANDRYTASVLTLQQHVEEARARWGPYMSDDNKNQFKTVTDTVGQLYNSIRHVDYDNGSAVVPALNDQLGMQAKLDGLTGNIEGARPGPFTCLTRCSQFRDALDVVTNVKNSLGLLAKSCNGNEAAAGQPSPSETAEATETPSAEPTNTTANSETNTAEPTSTPTQTATPAPAATTPSAEPASPTPVAASTVTAASPSGEPGSPAATPTTSDAAPSAEATESQTKADTATPTVAVTPKPTVAESGKSAETGSTKPTETTPAVAGSPSSSEIAKIVIKSDKPIRVTEESSDSGSDVKQSANVSKNGSSMTSEGSVSVHVG